MGTNSFQIELNGQYFLTILWLNRFLKYYFNRTLETVNPILGNKKMNRVQK